MKRRLSLFLLLALLLTGCAGVDKSDPILFETAEREEYISVLWEGREYIPFSGLNPMQRGEYLGHIQGAPDEELYTWKGHSSEEWLISYLDSGMMPDTMLLREVNVTEYPDGIASEYEWN